MKEFKESMDLVAEIEAAALEGGELPNLSLSLEHAQSVDRAVVALERLEISAEYFRKKAKQLMDVARELERAQAGIEANIKIAAQEQDVQDFFGESYRFKISRAKPRLEIDADALPAEFQTEKVTVVPNKSLIEAALDRGETVPGAEYKESFSLRTYANKKKELA